MEELRKSDFYFDLPEELIAQDPLEDRAASRLLVLDKKTGEYSHHTFRDIRNYLNPGDCLVLNNTKVIPARLMGVKEETGAAIEVLLLKRRENNVWETLVKPGKKAKIGQVVRFSDELTCTVMEHTDFGGRIVKFNYQGIFEETLDRLGETPLPPYIHEKLADKERYQTVYSREQGSAAAPTAGLHFTKEQLADLKASGINLGFVTLHVGLGTFRPVNEDVIEKYILLLS